MEQGLVLLFPRLVKCLTSVVINVKAKHVVGKTDRVSLLMINFIFDAVIILFLILYFQ